VVTGGGADSTAVLDGFIITAGQANGSYPEDSGGGMYNYQSSPTLTNVTFSGNSANYGGGMYTPYSSPTLMNVTFSGNSANYGGGMYNYQSSPTLTNVTFSGNSANYRGGGMYNDYQSSPTLTNVTFSGNSANYYYGGGMYNSRSSSPTLTNVTFSGNSANYYGGGMYNYNQSSPSLANVIMWGDTAQTGSEIYNYSSLPTISYSDIQNCGGSGASWDTTCGTDGGGNIDADPLFVDADGIDNTPGTDDDDLHLDTTSPCIDAGDNSAVPTGVTTDLDDNPRFVDIISVVDTGNGTPPIVDMGAYEVQTYTLAITKTGSGTGTVTSDPTGIDCGSTCSYQFAGGTTVTLTANPDPGSVFSGWSGDADCTDGQVTMNTDVNCTATFNLEADISITKTDGVTSAVPGSSVTYTITVTNSGPSADPSVTVADTFPSSLTCNYTSTVTGGATGNTASGSGNISDTLNMPSGSTVTYTANCNIDSGATGTLSNTATATASVTDPDTTNNSATDSDTLTPEADISVTKTDSPDPVTTGNTLTYTVTVTNNGPSDATDVTLTDTLQAGVTFVSTSSTQGTCSEASGTVTCNIGGMAKASVVTVTIKVTPNSGGTITNTATVSSSTTDSNNSNNTASEDTTVIALYSLTVTKTGSGTGTVTSNPAGVDCGNDCSESYASGTTVTLSATADADSVFTSWGGDCSACGTNSTCDITMDTHKTCTAIFDTIALPDLIVQSMTTDPFSPSEGENVDVTVTVKNQGSGDAGSFYIDFYKHRTTPPSSYELGDFACYIGGLSAGTTTTCSGTVSYSSAGTYQMWAQVDTDQQVTESDEGNNVFGPQDITVTLAYGTDTIGVKRGCGFYLRNTNDSGIADISFCYGLASDIPLTGDWDGW